MTLKTSESSELLNLTLNDKYVEKLRAYTPIIKTSTHDLTVEWSRLYLEAFNRKSFFSKDRVIKIFMELTSMFTKSLDDGDLTAYFEALKKTGKFFANIKVPFEEVILCIYLFRQALVNTLQESTSQNLKRDLLPTLNELGKIGTSIFAISYFKSTETQWNTLFNSYQEENESIRQKLKNFTSKQKSYNDDTLESIHSTIHKINHKLQTSNMYLREIHRFHNQLHSVADIKTILKISKKTLLKNLNGSAEILFAIFDESKKKCRIYGDLLGDSNSNDTFELIEEMLSERIHPAYLQAITKDSPKPASQKNVSLNPRLILPVSTKQECRSFAFIPLSKFFENIGFIWVASNENELSQTKIRYFARLSRHIATAIYSTNQYHQRRYGQLLTSELDNLIQAGSNKKSAELKIDHYLGTLLDSINIERASLMLFDASKKNLKIFAAKGYRVYPFSGATFNWGEGIAGTSIKEQKTICITRMKYESNEPVKVKSLACIPLSYQKKPIGVLNLSTLNYYKIFETSEIKIIQKLADVISKSLHEASLKLTSN